MNERIKQLAANAGYPDYMTYGQDKVLERFAELIVAECVSVIQEELDSGQYSQPVHTGFRVSKNLIKQHFGVEE
jgi:hypothetical protein